jgi:hypothetical protein
MGSITAVADLAAQVPPSTPSGQSSTNTILLLLLTSSVLAGLLTHVLAGLRASAAARRDRYADAVKVLVARLEYPYRIRRRTSDEPEVLASLVTIGHDLQERIAEMRAWIASEDQLLSQIFDQCLARLDGPVGQACNQAWNSPPITSAAEMNLNGFGPGNQQHIIMFMKRAIAYRFGARRCIPDWIIRRRLPIEHMSNEA